MADRCDYCGGERPAWGACPGCGATPPPVRKPDLTMLIAFDPGSNGYRVVSDPRLQRRAGFGDAEV